MEEVPTYIVEHEMEIQQCPQTQKATEISNGPINEIGSINGFKDPSDSRGYNSPLNPFKSKLSSLQLPLEGNSPSLPNRYI